PAARREPARMAARARERAAGRTAALAGARLGRPGRQPLPRILLRPRLRVDGRLDRADLAHAVAAHDGADRRLLPARPLRLYRRLRAVAPARARRGQEPAGLDDLLAAQPRRDRVLRGDPHLPDGGLGARLG